ncbi:MAG TPA: subclass B3 metallo-beta-lactamase [Blastocatellia bacterium]|nr:subclass B3 metallo-beta-lactamase [Blastocatellia bacterium]
MRRSTLFACVLILLVLAISLGGLTRRPQYTKATPGWNERVTPIRIIGNIYYVGASGVSSFLITTPKGHILLDSGFAETVPLIVEAVTHLGFKMEDVKFLINSHAHYDHAAGLAQLKRLTGGQLVLSEPDAATVANGGKGDFQWGDELTYEPAAADRILQDKDRVELGGVTMTARLTPGHTKGCTTWLTKVTEEGREYDVVFIGSTTSPGYTLVDNPRYPNIVADYEYTFRLLRSLPCDVFLGPHGSFFNLEEKADLSARGKKPNPFIEGRSYRSFLDRTEKDFLELLSKQKAAKSKNAS